MGGRSFQGAVSLRVRGVKVPGELAWFSFLDFFGGGVALKSF